MRRMVQSGAGLLLRLLEIQKDRSGEITLKELRELPNHGDAVRALQFGPDGKHLATGATQAGATTERTIKLWDVGKLVGGHCRE
jgi:WD40 repeat protein